MTQFFEDIVLGAPIELGAHEFTTEEIVSFAARFDPQPFHLDAEAARDTFFGGLCASGWHTACVWMRLMAAERARAVAQAQAAGRRAARHGPSPGFRHLRWLKPVYPGDVIRYRSVPEEKLDVASRPAYGLLVSRNEGVNQHGDLVISFLGRLLVERQTPRAQGD